MELSGLFLLSDEFDLEGVENGSYDYLHFWLVLRAVSDGEAADFGLQVQDVIGCARPVLINLLYG
jgi:hypothetical protein